MHSSRMRTGRSLTVCWRLLPEGGSGGSAPGGVCSGGSAPGGRVWSQGGSAPGGMVRGDGGDGIPACTEADPPLCGQNHRRL